MFSNSVSVKSYPFNKSDIRLINNDKLARDAYPIVYILYNTETMVAYVGESTNAINRMSNHLTHPEKKRLKSVYIISGESFNKSAALDIESHLIQYITAAGDFRLLNGNGGYLVKTKSFNKLANKMIYCVKNYKKSLLKNSTAKTKLNRFLIVNNSEKYFGYLKSFY